MNRTFEFHIDTRKFNQHITAIARKQIPFAVANTLTKTAKDAQKALDVEMATVMTLRSPDAKRGLIVTPARKKDGIRLMQAAVGHRSWFMAQQMGKRSVTRRPKTAEWEYIPRGVRRTKKGRISRNYKPKNVFKMKGTYITKPKGGRAGVFKVVRGRPRLLYSAIKEQTITPKMDLEKTADLTARKRINRNFIKAMREAISTARP